MHKAILVLVFLFVVLLILSGSIDVYTKSQCYSLGYTTGKVDVFLNQYCIKRVDQTDVVVSLDQLRRKEQ